MPRSRSRPCAIVSRTRKRTAALSASALPCRGVAIRYEASRLRKGDRWQARGGGRRLIPTDVKTTETGELWDQSLRLTDITRKLRSEADHATHFVVFDACRNTLKLRKPGTRALVQSKGIVPVVQENGMLIAYTTAKGELASDLGDGGRPYAKVLADELVKRGVEAVAMFRRVQVRVRSSIGQEPWLGFGKVDFAGAHRHGQARRGSPESQLQRRRACMESCQGFSSVPVLEAFIAR